MTSSLITDITDLNYEQEVLNADKPVVIDFWAEWCGPCRTMGKVINDLAKEEDKIKFVKINVDDNETLTRKFNIRSIPTLVVMQGNKEIARIVGGCSKTALKKRLDDALQPGRPDNINKKPPGFKS